MGQEGKVVCLCLWLRHFLVALSDEIDVVHDVHCLTRGNVAFYAQSTQVDTDRWQQAYKVEVSFKGHKGDQEQIGSVRCLLYTSPSPRDRG